MTLRCVLAVVLGLGLCVQTVFAEVRETGDVVHDGPLPNWHAVALQVGATGPGELTVDGGSQVFVHDFFVGTQAGSEGLVVVKGAGSSLEAGSWAEVGTSGDGTLRILRGGFFEARDLSVGVFAGSTGRLVIDGQRSAVDCGWLNLGYGGEGFLEILNGGYVDSVGGQLGQFTGSSGIATVSGPGSLWYIRQDLSIGGNEYYGFDFDGLGYGGTGALTICDGGEVLVNKETRISPPGAGAIHFEGGVLSTGGLWASLDDLTGVGTINTTGLVSDMNLTFDSPASVTQSIVLDGDGRDIRVNLDANATAAMGVGYVGNGSMAISGGTVVESLNGYFGCEAGSIGTGTVSGEGSAWILTQNHYGGDLHVGVAGQGELSIADGGYVECEQAEIGVEIGSVGTVSVVGAGSTLRVEKNLAVGVQGSGDLEISAGGLVTVGKDTIVAAEPDVTGAIRFDGGVLETGGLLAGRADLSGEGVVNAHGLVSDVDLVFSDTFRQEHVTLFDGAGAELTINLDIDGTGSLGAGFAGEGSLTISGGQSIESSYGYLGYKVGSTGVASVSGEGSAWTIDRDLVVGRGGEGMLTISDGAVVRSEDSYDDAIGELVGSRGEVLVTGEGSAWYAGHIEIGKAGEGTLRVLDGAHFTSQTTRIASTMDHQPPDENVFYTTGVGEVTVSGEGTTWSAGSIYVGGSGQGVVDILDGAAVTAFYTGVGGCHDDAHGVLNVVGATLETEYLMVEGGQRGQLTIDGGSVEVLNHASWGSPPGEGPAIEFANGGTLTTREFWGSMEDVAGEGTINTHGLQSDIDLVFDSPESLVQSFTFSDETRNITLNLDLDGTGMLSIGDGSLTITNGVHVVASEGSVGCSPDSTGVATVSGDQTVWETPRVFVGSSGEGELNILDGASVVTEDCLFGVGRDSRPGTGTVSGNGSKLSTDMLSMGFGGSGDLNVVDGGAVEANVGVIGDWNDVVGVTSTVSVRGADSTMTFGELTIGAGASGIMTIDGATVTVAGDTCIGSDNYPEARSVFEGDENAPSSFWGEINEALPNTSVVLANGGTLTTGGLLANLNQITGDGTINAHGLVADVDWVFDSPDDLTRTIHLDGPGRNVTLNLDLDGTAGLGAGYAGAGSIEISHGQVVTSAAGYAGYLPGSTGRAVVAGEGSRWDSGPLRIGHGGAGTLDILDSASVASGTSHVGDLEGSAGAVTVVGDGSSWSTGDLYIGTEGAGSMYICDGGQVTSCDVLLGGGYWSPGVGVVAVSGEGSMWVTSNLSVGEHGQGILTVCDGAEVCSSAVSIGEDSNSKGSVTVTGAGSRWTAWSMDIGERGDGALYVLDGGLVDSGDCRVGMSGVTGQVVVSGTGSAWITGDLDLGWQGKADLQISNGGHVCSDKAALGYGTDSAGKATVDGIESTWEVWGDLAIGDYGPGELNVFGGALVISESARMGGDYRGVGVTTVCGAGSTWINQGSLHIGVDGVGCLTILDGGDVTVGADLNIGARGMLDIDVTDAHPRLTAGSINNGGRIRLAVQPGTAGGVCTPIAVTSNGLAAWNNSGDFLAYGGVWDESARTFTVGDARVATSGELVVMDLSAEQRVEVDGGLGVAFLADEGGALVDVSATAIEGDELMSLLAMLDEDETVESAWDIEIDGLAGGEDVMLSMALGRSLLDEDVSVWRYDEITGWSLFDTDDLVVTDDWARFATDSFGGYAVTSVPEPATMSLMALGAAVLIRRRRPRGSAVVAVD